MGDMSNENLSRRNFIRTASTGLIAATVPTTQLAPLDKQPPDLKLPRSKLRVGYAIAGLGKLAKHRINAASHFAAEMNHFSECT